MSSSTPDPVLAQTVGSATSRQPPVRFQTNEPNPTVLGTPVVVYATGTLQRWLARIGWLGFLVCGLIVLVQWVSLAEYFDTSGGIYERFHSGAPASNAKVAIIDVSGVIMEGDGFVKRQIDRIRVDQDIKAIVLRVDSPGGTVTGSDYIYHYLNKLRTDRPEVPMVVSMGSLAASGGYYVSMAVGHEPGTIFAEPTCTTGSIGVIIPHYDFSKLLERFDVRDDSISSHPRKQMLSMTRAITDEDRQLVQGYVNESYERFLEVVRSGRAAFAADPDALRRLATGEIFSATQAQKNGLIDKLGFLDDAIARACEMAHVQPDHVRVVRFERPRALLDIPGLAQTESRQGELATLFALSTPRAYYLATSLPTLMTSRRAD